MANTSNSEIGKACCLPSKKHGHRWHPETKKIVGRWSTHIIQTAFVLVTILTATETNGQTGRAELIFNTAPFAQRLGSTQSDEGRAVAVAPSGNWFASGVFRSRASLFGSQPLLTITSLGGADGYVVGYGPNNEVKFLKQVGGAGEDEILDMALTVSGKVAVVGNFSGSMVFGSDTLLAQGNSDGFVALMDTLGRPLWARRFGSADTTAVVNDNAFCLAALPNGGVAIGGAFGTRFSFGTGVGVAPLEGHATMQTGFLVAIDSNGGLVWQQAIRGPRANSRAVRGVVCSPNGQLFATGSFGDSTRFGLAGPWLKPTAGTTALFVAKFKARTGLGFQAMAISGSAVNIGRGIAYGGMGGGRILVAGRYRDSAFVPTGTDTFVLKSEGLVDGFFCNLDTSLSVQWIRNVGSGGNDIAISATALPAGEWLGLGYFQQSGRFMARADTSVLRQTSAGGSDVFLVRYDANGQAEEIARYGGAAEDLGYAIRAAWQPSGNTCTIVTTGYYTGNATFIGGPVLGTNPSTTRDAFATKVTIQRRPVAIERTSGASGFVFPNPCPSGSLLNFGAGQGKHKILVSSATGKVVWQGNIETATNKADFDLIWSRQPPGVFAVRRAGICNLVIKR